MLCIAGLNVNQQENSNASMKAGGVQQSVPEESSSVGGECCVYVHVFMCVCVCSCVCVCLIVGPNLTFIRRYYIFKIFYIQQLNLLGPLRLLSHCLVY